MIDWIIMGIVFAIIIGFAVYVIWKNRQSKKEPLEKKSFWQWIIDTVSHIHQ
jgi:F0F1-type ATP synthase membrane subunit a